MKHKNTQKLTLAAMTAAAYAALSLLGAVFGLTFGPIQEVGGQAVLGRQ